MSILAPEFSVSVDLGRKEVHFAASGFWDMLVMTEFQRELIAKSRPLFENGAKIRSLGDLRGFVTQKRDVSDAMHVIIEQSAKLGTVRTAIISDSTLATLQYRRLNEGINMRVFDSKLDALTWLRAND